MVEDDYEDGEETYATVVVALEGERWQHAWDTGDGRGNGSTRDRAPGFLIY